MTDAQMETAQACLDAAEADTMAFPQIVGRLMAAGFESYAIDLRRANATYFLPSGEAMVLPAIKPQAAVAGALDTDALTSAIREAQQNAPGYTYRGFCKKAAMAGCAGYVVSFSGRRALYIGRTAETHVEYFPD